MGEEISYGHGAPIASTIALPSTLTTSEVDLFIATDGKYLKHSQFSVMVSLDLGAVMSGTFFYYVSPDGGTNWYPVSNYNISTGEITQRKVVVDSGTYVTGGHSKYNDDVPVTGKAASGTPTLNAVIVCARNN